MQRSSFLSAITQSRVPVRSAAPKRSSQLQVLSNKNTKHRVIAPETTSRAPFKDRIVLSEAVWPRPDEESCVCAHRDGALLWQQSNVTAVRLCVLV